MTINDTSQLECKFGFVAPYELTLYNAKKFICMKANTFCHMNIDATTYTTDVIANPNLALSLYPGDSGSFCIIIPYLSLVECI